MAVVVRGGVEKRERQGSRLSHFTIKFEGTFNQHAARYADSDDIGCVSFTTDFCVSVSTRSPTDHAGLGNDSSTTTATFTIRERAHTHSFHREMTA